MEYPANCGVLSFFFDIYPWHTLFCFPEEIHRIHHFGSSSLYSCPVLIRRNNINSHLFNEPIIFFRAYGKKFAFGTLKKFLQKKFSNPWSRYKGASQ